MRHRGHHPRTRLHRRLFWAFGLSILVTGLTVAAVMTAVGGHGRPTWHDEVTRVSTFVGGRFALAWDDPAARDELARAMARDLDVDVTVTDARAHPLVTVGAACERPGLVAPVLRGREVLGSVVVCLDRHHRAPAAWRLGLALVVAGAVLWAMAGRVARRLTRPLTELVNVVQDIGRGKLTSRAALRCDVPGEVGRLACVVNDMAARITRQLDDQRQLLAAVSHEIRAPLARMRFLVEMARGGASPKTLDELEAEVEGIDALVGDLLANARVDFGSLSPRLLDAEETARLALDRGDEDQGLLKVDARVDGSGATFHGDATLVACALANLLANARRHGGGVRVMRVREDGARVVFAVDDGGDGFAPDEMAHAFEPFYRGKHGGRGGVGLGLALVKRIAEAHGGRAWAENLPDGGARVAIEFPMTDERTTRSED